MKSKKDTITNIFFIASLCSIAALVISGCIIIGLALKDVTYGYSQALSGYSPMPNQGVFYYYDRNDKFFYHFYDVHIDIIVSLIFAFAFEVYTFIKHKRIIILPFIYAAITIESIFAIFNGTTIVFFILLIVFGSTFSIYHFLLFAKECKAMDEVSRYRLVCQHFVSSLCYLIVFLVFEATYYAPYFILLFLDPTVINVFLKILIPSFVMVLSIFNIIYFIVLYCIKDNIKKRIRESVPPIKHRVIDYILLFLALSLISYFFQIGLANTYDESRGNTPFMNFCLFIQINLFGSFRDGITLRYNAYVLGIFAFYVLFVFVENFSTNKDNYMIKSLILLPYAIGFYNLIMASESIAHRHPYILFTSIVTLMIAYYLIMELRKKECHLKSSIVSLSIILSIFVTGLILVIIGVVIARGHLEEFVCARYLNDNFKTFIFARRMFPLIVLEIALAMTYFIKDLRIYKLSKNNVISE